MTTPGDTTVVVVLAISAVIHAAGLLIILWLLRDSHAMSAETTQLIRQVEGWLEAQDETTRKRHAAILRQFGLD